MTPSKLSDLIDHSDPGSVLKEVQATLYDAFPNVAMDPIVTAFGDIVALYEGRNPGFHACSTGYHDLQHTTDTFLAMARLLHGGAVLGETFSADHVATGLISALYHDSGYLQEITDTEGTGAKYTLDHEERGAAFFERYGRSAGMSTENLRIGRLLILSTDLSESTAENADRPPAIGLLCRLMVAADLLAQMSERNYLEKLLFLYREFREAGIDNYPNELDLLNKTIGFYDVIDQRLEHTADQIDRFLVAHFQKRWQIPVNLYREAINRQKAYLVSILSTGDNDPRGRLRRGGIVEAIKNTSGDTRGPKRGKDVKHRLDEKMVYTALDRPEILTHIFYPRTEVFHSRETPVENLMIPVDRDVSLGARLHRSDASAPNILFFHGNGEIAADYDELGTLITRCGVNFIVVDYRGYGRSGGSSTVTTMMADSHRIFAYLTGWLPENGLTGPMIVMGRSLGSASALELAAAHPNRIRGLVIDSGFADTLSLLKRLGVDVEHVGPGDSSDFGQREKIATFTHPVLIIHGEQDVIIPFTDGATLYDASPAADKTLLAIPGAGHNDIFSHGLTSYMDAVAKFCRQVTAAFNSSTTTRPNHDDEK
ncbi:temperature sensitive supressor-like [Olavius algarvensis associated proteobacterium Delta 3]|nr:temperature sensitive supressor-like [Olavius algarvensis associated proteobacterium Delta 3]